MGEAVRIIEIKEPKTMANGYRVSVKYGDKKLVDCMKNVIKLTLSK